MIQEIKDGKRLLKLFREAQERHGYEGCLCSECEMDMAEALLKLKKEAQKCQ